MNDQILTVINFINNHDAYDLVELIDNRVKASNSEAYNACASAATSKAYMAHAELQDEPLEDCIINTIECIDEFFRKTGGNKRNYPQYKEV